MAGGVSIRLARPEDAVALPPIELASGTAFRAYPDIAWVADEEPDPADIHAARIVADTVWLAKLDGAIAGFVSAERIDAFLHVWSLQVAPDFQKRGIGRRLMDTAIGHARDAGLDAVTLTTFRDIPFNEVFYASIGFERIDDLSSQPFLSRTIEAEVAQGLPREKRCAMRLIFKD